MATKSQETKKPEPTFENAIERLETIVQQMESDKLPLEELLLRYEEGLKLVKFCSEKLDTASKRIEIITRDAAGKPQITEFEPGTTSSQEPVSPKRAVPATGKGATHTSEQDEVSLF